MKPLQVYVETHELRRLDVWARRRGWTKSQAVRAAISALTRDPKEDPVLSLSGLVQGLPADLSANFDCYFEETFRAKPQARKRRRKSAVRR